jgi:hypothetical protein
MTPAGLIIIPRAIGRSLRQVMTKRLGFPSARSGNGVSHVT